ncbi:ATP/GTP-binding protein [Paraphoma chrysanthemicola]|nr:ATP/GTP-binding protein [Paraphoma chrysanthemicola]
MDFTVRNVLGPHLQRNAPDNHPVVVMTCGIAGELIGLEDVSWRLAKKMKGSGKTTLAKAIEAAYPNFHRISGDEIIHQRHGIYGIDYEASPSLYAEYQDEQDEIYMSTFRALLDEKKDIILERSFYAKEDRDEYRGIAEKAGARVVLVFLKAEGESGKECLWTRIRQRSKGIKTADSALDISRETFDYYWNGFENPDGEGEVVVQVK